MSEVNIPYDNTEYTRGMNDAITALKKAIEKRNKEMESDSDLDDISDGSQYESDDELDNPIDDNSSNGNDESEKNGENQNKSGKDNEASSKNKNDDGENESEDDKLIDPDQAINQKNKNDIIDKGPGGPIDDKPKGPDGPIDDGPKGPDGPIDDDKYDPDAYSDNDEILDKIVEDTTKGDKESYEEYSKKYLENTVKEAEFSDSNLIKGFLEKCKSCSDSIRNVILNTSEDGAGWLNKSVKQVNSYINQKIKKHQTTRRKTYARIPRRQSLSKTLLKKGEMVEKDKVSISVNFYIDGSGSMHGDRIENSCIAANKIADALDKEFGTNPETNEAKYNFYIFYTDFRSRKDYYIKVDRGHVQSNAYEDNPPLQALMYHIAEDTNKEGLEMSDALINILITDGQFDNSTGVTQFLNKYKDYMFIYITNLNTPVVKAYDKHYGGNYDNISYVQANRSFEID